MDNDLSNIMKGLGKMMSADTLEDSEAAFEDLFKDQIADAENAPQMPDTITLEYSDGSKETLTQKSK